MYQNLSMPFKSRCGGDSTELRWFVRSNQKWFRGHQYPNETLAERSLVYLPKILYWASLFKLVKSSIVVIPRMVFRQFQVPLHYMESCIKYIDKKQDFLWTDSWVFDTFYTCILALLVCKMYQNPSMPFKADVEGILLSCVGSSGQTRNGSRGHQYPNETLAERSLVCKIFYF